MMPPKENPAMSSAPGGGTSRSIPAATRSASASAVCGGGGVVRIPEPRHVGASTRKCEASGRMFRIQ